MKISEAKIGMRVIRSEHVTHLNGSQYRVGVGTIIGEPFRYNHTTYKVPVKCDRTEKIEGWAIARIREVSDVN